MFGTYSCALYFLATLTAPRIQVERDKAQRDRGVIPEVSANVDQEVITGDSFNPADNSRRHGDHERSSRVVPVLVALSHLVDGLRHQ